MVMAPRPKPPKTYCFICGFLGRFDAFYPVVRWHLKYLSGATFRMSWDEHVLRRCATCHRKNGTGHKMDCYREYWKNDQ